MVKPKVPFKSRILSKVKVGPFNPFVRKAPKQGKTTYSLSIFIPPTLFTVSRQYANHHYNEPNPIQIFGFTKRMYSFTGNCYSTLEFGKRKKKKRYQLMSLV